MNAPCVRCGKAVQLDNAVKCNNCWEVEHRLDEYLESALGRAYVRVGLDEAMEKAERRARQASVDAKVKRMITPTEAGTLRGNRFPTIALETAEKYIDACLANDLKPSREDSRTMDTVIDLAGFEIHVVRVMLERYRALGWNVVHDDKVQYRFWYHPRGPIDHTTFAP